MRLFKPQTQFQELSSIPIAASAIHIATQAADFREILLQQIASAHKRIVLCSLYLQNDEAGQEIMAALLAAKAARPELQISVFVDWHRAQRGLIGAKKEGDKPAGNAAWYQEIAAQMGQSQALAIYGVPVQTRELFGVLHLKGYVFDDTVLYSGASINNVYLHKFDKYRHDRYWLIQSAELANQFYEYMAQYFVPSSSVHRLDHHHIPATRQIRAEIRAFRTTLKKATYPALPPALEKGRGSLTVCPIVGVGKNNVLNRSICQLLAQATQEIMICTPYFNFPMAVTREINRALKRGVRVSVVVGDKTANDFYIPPEQPFSVIGTLPYLYEMNLRRFLKAHDKAVLSGQLQLHLWKDGEHTYHLKGMWVDQTYTLVTGNNLNPRAFRLDLENALLFHDPQLVLLEQRQAELVSIFRNTTQLVSYRALESLPDYPPKVAQWLSRLSRVRLDRLAYRVL